MEDKREDLLRQLARADQRLAQIQTVKQKWEEDKQEILAELAEGTVDPLKIEQLLDLNGVILDACCRMTRATEGKAIGHIKGEDEREDWLRVLSNADQTLAKADIEKGQREENRNEILEEVKLGTIHPDRIKGLLAVVDTMFEQFSTIADAMAKGAIETLEGGEE